MINRFSFHSVSLLAVSVISGLNSWEGDVKFLEFVQYLGGQSFQSKPSFLNVSCNTRTSVSRGNPESQRGGVHWLRKVGV